MASSTTPRAFRSFICQSCRQRLSPTTTTTFHRAFTTTLPTHFPEPTDLANPSSPSSQPTQQQSQPARDSAMTGLSMLSGTVGRMNISKGFNNSTSPFLQAMDDNSSPPDDYESLLSGDFTHNLHAFAGDAKPHRLHVMATKHNTHITFVQPQKPAATTAPSSSSSSAAADQKKMIDVLLSLSTGNIGFRKAGRGSYDAAYQLAAFTLKQMQDKGMLRGVQKLEVVLRGFGAGRDAVTKAILGAEGRLIRGKISAVVDATRLKLGGPRSRKPRRLG